MGLWSNTNHPSELEKDLHGSTLQVYWYILRQPKKNFSYTEIQNVMGFSSKSSAIYQLEKLCDLQILQKTLNGYQLISKPKPHLLRSYFFFRHLLIPKSLVYSLLLTFTHLIILVLLINEFDIIILLLASIPNFLAIILFVIEATLVWKIRPKPPDIDKESDHDIQNDTIKKSVIKPEILGSENSELSKSNKSVEKKFRDNLLIFRTSLSRLLSKYSIFFAGLIIIFLLLSSAILIGFLIGFPSQNYAVHIEDKNEITFNEPIPITLQKTGYTIHKTSFYALGEFRNATGGKFLFQFNFNNNVEVVESFSKYELPSHLPSLGKGLAYNGSLYWAFEKGGNQTHPQRLFCFSKDMTYIQNFSLDIPLIVDSMNL